ncbi:MAG: phosphatase [Lachnospira sp.]|nr:phosphatase [Lachnospira sp.]
MNMTIDLHTHSIASGHAFNTIDEMAKYAADKGVTHLGITEHAPMMPGTCHEFYFQNLHIVPREKFGVKLFLGAEVNILNDLGEVDLSNGLLKRLDVVIASMHTPCMKPNTVEYNTNAVINAMKNPYINIIGHPDDSRYPLDYEKIVMASKEYNTLLEINNASLNPKGPRKNAAQNDELILQLCKEHKVPVILGSDAHIGNRICNFENLMPLIEKIEFPMELIVNTSFDKLEKYLTNLI